MAQSIPTSLPQVTRTAACQLIGQFSSSMVGSVQVSPLFDTSPYKSIQVSVSMPKWMPGIEGQIALQPSLEGGVWDTVGATTTTAFNGANGADIRVHQFSPTSVVRKWSRFVWMPLGYAPVHAIYPIADVEGSLAGKYFTVGGTQMSGSPSNYPTGDTYFKGHQYAFWFRVNGSGSVPVFDDPAIAPMRVDIPLNATVPQVIAAVSAAFASGVCQAMFRTTDNRSFSFIASTGKPTTSNPNSNFTADCGVYVSGTYLIAGLSNSFKSTDNGATWDWSGSPTTGTGFTMNLSRMVYVPVGPSGVVMFTMNAGTRPWIVRSPDLGVTWFSATVPGVTSSTSSPLPLMISGSRVFLYANNSGGYSDDGGVSWTYVSTMGGSYGSPTCGAWTGNKYVVAVDGGSVYYWSATGESWAMVAAFPFGTSFVPRTMAADPATGRVVALAQDSRAYTYSLDGGTTWAIGLLPASVYGIQSNLAYDAAHGQFMAASSQSLWTTSDMVAWSGSVLPLTGVNSVGFLVLPGSGTNVLAARLGTIGPEVNAYSFFPRGTASFGYSAGGMSGQASNLSSPAIGTFSPNSGTSGFRIEQLFPLAETSFTASIWGYY